MLSTFWQRCPSRAPLLFIFIFLLNETLVSQQLPSSAASDRREIWAETRLAGEKSGYYHEKVESAAGPGTVTSIETDLAVNRLGSKVEIKSQVRYEESPDGRLRALQSDISSSMQSTAMNVVVGARTLAIRATTGGKTYMREVPFTGDLLGPVGMRRAILTQLKKPGDTIQLQTFSPELGTIVMLTSTRVAADALQVENHSPALKIEQTVSAIPGKTTVWLDSEGWLLRQVAESPFGEIEALVTDLQQVLGATSRGAALPDEVFTRTTVRSNIRLPEERLIERIKLRITHKKPELGWPDFAAENQRILEKTRDKVVLEIRRPAPRPGSLRPVAKSPDLAPYLVPNPLLQSDDPAVREIAIGLVEGDHDVFRSARALQMWTRENMLFDPGIMIASASEVVRDRRGTCMGYAVMLASLARAVGIPSRVRMGLVYTGGMWGGHAWVDVLVGRDWIPLDGALYSPGPADAARISFFTTSLEEGTIAQVGSLAKLFGNVDIQVLEYTVNGRTTVVPSDARPFTVDGDTYHNPWLGLTVVKPASFRFEKLDSVWPESTVVALEGPNGQRVEIDDRSGTLPVSGREDLSQELSDVGITGNRSAVEVDGRRALLIASPGKAGLVMKEGGGIWRMTASGPEARELLLKVASTMRLTAAPARRNTSRAADPADPKFNP